ncbi:MAG: hypothetical protein KBD47_02145 [Candidatus Pacebacteria bacterium]|jgi:hypothetical protein|nr:hypothetical protein [Candidatus Paceibacterota bacterium]
MKDFLKKITHDPYIDWFIIFSLGVAGLFFAVVWAYVEYQDVNSVDITAAASTTKITTVDIKKVDEVIQQYTKKKAVYDAPNLPSIDVRDPSL